MANLNVSFKAGENYKGADKVCSISPVTWDAKGKTPATLGFRLSPSGASKQAANFDWEAMQDFVEFFSEAKNRKQVKDMLVKAAKLSDKGVAFERGGDYKEPAKPERKSAKPKVENVSGEATAKMTKADARELKEAGFSASEVMAEVKARGGWAAE